MAQVRPGPLAFTSREASTSGFHLYRPKNGSGVRSPFYSFHFSIRGTLVRGATGERDRRRAEVEAARQFLEAHRRANLPVPRQALIQLQERSLADLAGMFVSKIEQDIEQRTISRNSRYVKDLRFDLRHITPHFDHIEDLTSTAWRAALNEMHAGYPEAKKDGAISWRYAQRITVTARALLRYANTLGVLPVVPELPAPSNEDVELEQKRGEPVTERERDQFLRALRKLGTTRRGARRAHRIYTALLYTSLRKSGLERLTLKQIDFATKTIELPPRKAKSKKRREIALHPKAERAIKQELAERGNIDPEEPIFGGFDLREWFTEAMALAKIKRRLQPHHFTRHTAATIAGNRGATLAQLMALGSWETPAMAMRYVKIDAQRSREAQALLDAPLRKKAVRKKRGRSGAQGR